MKISFICLCYNQQESIIKLIKSIQYSCINYEIIIIDDCSTDNSVNNIKQLKDNNIIIIENSVNLNNQSYSRNLGISKSTGDYIMYMDGDDYYNSYELHKLYKLLPVETDCISLNTIHLTENYITSFTYNTEEILHSVTLFCIKKDYLLKYNIKWEETKYYVDGEDFYYTFELLTFNPSILYTNLYTAHTIRTSNSNSLKKYKNKLYPKYIYNMCIDIILYCTSNNNFNLIKYINTYEINETDRYLEANNENNTIMS